MSVKANRARMNFYISSFFLGIMCIFFWGCKDPAAPKVKTSEGEADAAADKSEMVVEFSKAKAVDCPSGGVLIEKWRDLDGDKKFDKSEPDYSKETVCNGDTGTSGAASRVRLRDATAEQCGEGGGTVFETWLDKNNDGKYQPNEPDYKTSIVCRGSLAANLPGFRHYDARADQCADGGVVVESWAEENGNNEPDQPNELSSLISNTVCSQASNAVKVSNAAGECSGAGLIVETWKDKNSNGTYESGTDTEYNREVQCVENSLVKIVSISPAGLRACAVLSDSTATCWGRNYPGYGSLGQGATNEFYDTTVTAKRVRVFGTSQVLKGVKEVVGGRFHSCALLGSGEVYCWGVNGDGQLGTGDYVESHTARKVAGITNAIKISSGTLHTCALLEGNELKCWGRNARGQLGNNQTTKNNLPQLILSDAKDISVGGEHTCATRADDKLYCWGYNGYGQLGTGDKTSLKVPTTAVAGLGDIHSFTAGDAAGTNGYDTTCAITGASRNVYCWGVGNGGQLGNNAKSHSSTPVQVLRTDSGSALNQVKKIGAGGGHICALTDSGNFYCWGRNNAGQLGVGNRTDLSLATRVKKYDGSGDLGVVKDFFLGGGYDQYYRGTTFVVLDDDSIFSFGYNEHGQLGINTRKTVDLPVGLHISETL